LFGSRRRVEAAEREWLSRSGVEAQVDVLALPDADTRPSEALKANCIGPVMVLRPALPIVGGGNGEGQEVERLARVARRWPEVRLAEARRLR